MNHEAGGEIGPGDRVDGRFRVVECLDKTPSARAFAVHDEMYDQPTALAVLEPGGGAARLERFVREARAMAGVASPHAPKVYAVGELPGGAAYVAMEQIDGDDMGEVLRAHGALPVERAVDVALQALDALAFAHDGGILHCEVSPRALVSANAGGESLVKLVDFRFTTGARAGGDETLRYAAPEQVRGGRAVDARADIYAVGAVLYELLCGVPAIAGASHDAIAKNVLDLVPPLPCDLRPEVPPALSAVVMRCLEKDPADRYETVGDLAPALAPYGSGAFAHCVARAQIVLGKVPGVNASWSRPAPALPPEAPPVEAAGAEPIVFVPMSASWPLAPASDRTRIVARPAKPAAVASSAHGSHRASILAVGLAVLCVTLFAGARVLLRRPPATAGHAPETAQPLPPAEAPAAATASPSSAEPSAVAGDVAPPPAQPSPPTAASSARPAAPAPAAPRDKRAILRDRR